MKKVLQHLAILTLVVWGVVFLYFYASGRIEKYLDPSFRIYALLSGIGFLLLAGFNFINRNRAVGACTHDHAHGDACDHEHHHRPHGEAEHSHEHGGCGHHDHGESCDHEHHGHGHGAACEHEHEQVHDHAHDHEESTSGLAFSLLVLLAPLLVATGYSTDKFSAEYLAKWGKIERQMMQMRIADSRAKARPPASSQPVANPYAEEGAAGAATDDTAPYPGQPDAPPEAKEAKTEEAWGSFTLEDLKKMVPQNEKGEFLLDVPQIFYTAGDRELMEVMEGIPVETTAQLMEETLNNPDKTRLKAFRLFIECCAADARPLSIPIDFGKAPPEYTEMGWYKLYGQIHYANENDEIIPMIRIERIEATSEPSDGLLF